MVGWTLTVYTSTMTFSDTIGAIEVTLLGTIDTFGPITLKDGFAQNEVDTFIFQVPEIGIIYGLTFNNSVPSDSWILGNATLESVNDTLVLTFGYNVVVTTPVAVKANEVDCYSLSLQTENSTFASSQSQFYVNITGAAGTSLYYPVPLGIQIAELVIVPLIVTVTTGTPYTVNLLNMDPNDAWAITTGNLTLLDNLFDPSIIYLLPSVIARYTAYLQLPSMSPSPLAMGERWHCGHHAHWLYGHHRVQFHHHPRHRLQEEHCSYRLHCRREPALDCVCHPGLVLHRHLELHLGEH